MNWTRSYWTASWWYGPASRRAVGGGADAARGQEYDDADRKRRAKIARRIYGDELLEGGDVAGADQARQVIAAAAESSRIAVFAMAEESLGAFTEEDEQVAALLAVMLLDE